MQQPHTPHVFVSYRRADAGAADAVAAALQGAHATWRDTAGIRGGQVWRETIVRAIDSAYALVLLVSTGTEHSKEVYAEYFYALGRGVPVIPLRVEDCPLPFGLASVLARDWDRDRALLLNDLDGWLAGDSRRAPADDLQTYLNSLRLDYLLNVANYTPMRGAVRRRPVSPGAALRAVEMRTVFTLRRTSALRGAPAPAGDVHDYADLLPALRATQRAVLLGEPGIGKTTTLYKYADELARACEADAAAPIPLILPLREWKGDTPLDTFVANRLGVLAGQCTSLLAAGRLYLLCDGLNEIDRDGQRGRKIETLRSGLAPTTSMVVTCRELDYRDPEVGLDLDTVSIHALDPSRVLDFLVRYLVDARGEQAGRAEAETLFWQIAGGPGVRAVWEKWKAAGADLDLFFQAGDIPRAAPAVLSSTLAADDTLWRTTVNTPANLVHLAANPYLLWMFLAVHGDLGRIPDNRGALFDEFVFQLLRREGLTEGERAGARGAELLARLEDLAWDLQHRAVAAGGAGRGVELTMPRGQAVQALSGEDTLRLAASANLLEDADPVRFSHQLLQEYFSARRLLGEIDRGLEPAAFWAPDRWWTASGWDEALVLAAGIGQHAAGQVYDWVMPANPEAAAACVLRSGMAYDDERKQAMRTAWLSRLTDHERQPEAARAAIGRALGAVRLAGGAALDDRPGVGLREDGTPDIAWVEVGGGRVLLERRAGRQTVGGFSIARYPVTHAQFEAFVEAADGYRNDQWWADLEPHEPAAAGWSETNSPRETVSWYEAVAYCRWLSERLGYTVRLPTEFEWQLAATGGNARRKYPWGERAEGHCNSGESRLNRTTAVGLYPHGTWAGGPLDMAGNVWEWCLNKYEDPADDTIEVANAGRVLRGGAWYLDSARCRAAVRNDHSPGKRRDSIGFRLLRPPSNGR